MTGQPLLRAACPGCGAPAETALVCEGCGTPLAPVQRRVVTLLFADLAGYTALCANRDPEDVHLLVRPLMNALRKVCEDLGGVVPSIEGDGFLAAFGARGSQEDDPARALAAAVDMHRLVAHRLEALPELTGLHVGAHVGEVVVAPSWEGVGLSLSGDPVNTASRLCKLTEPGELIASEQLVALAGRVDGWSAPRTVSVRGRHPIQIRTFSWAGAKEVLPPAWGASGPYVARPVLEATLHDFLRGGGAFVSGQAGSGKSRLVTEALRESRVALARCASFRTPRVSELLALLVAQVAPDRESLQRGLRGELVMDSRLDGEGGRIDAALEVLAQVAGLVVVIDDAERLPFSEWEVLSRLIERHVLRLVVVSRELPATPTALPVLEVAELTAAESLQLLETLLPAATPELQSAVLSRAGGSPLYLEQCSTLLRENGAVVVDADGSHLVQPERLNEVPTSMRLFVSGRLDLLSDAERDVLRVAAVLGSTPEVSLLRHLVGAEAVGHLDALVERGLLTWRSTELGEAQLSFAHALVRDVAYESELRSRRAAVHRAAAEWYSVLPVSHVLEAQAFHLEAAVALGDADCDAVRRTVEAMVLYARSIEAERVRVALEVLVRTRELVARRPECAPDTLQLELAWSAVNEMAGHESIALAAARTARELARERGEDRALAEATLFVGRALTLSQPQESASALDEADAMFEQFDDTAGLARVEIERAIIGEKEHGLAELIRHLERAYQLAMRSADARLQATAAQQLALHHAAVSGRTAFQEWSSQALAISRPDDAGLAPRLDLATAVLATYDLHAARGLEAARRALVAGRELGLRHVHMNALLFRCELLMMDGQHEEAQSFLVEARHVASTRPTAGMHLLLNVIESRLAQQLGSVERAELLLQEVEGHDLGAQAELRRETHEARSWLALDGGRFGEARAQAVQASLIDDELATPVASLRPRMIAIVAAAAAGENVPLGDISALQQRCRETGLLAVGSLMSRWLLVDELTHGWTVDLHGLIDLPDLIEARALDHEIAALAARDWDRLLDAATEWARLGDTVWQARAWLWHSELTGTDRPEADELLTRLNAPAGLAETLRDQVSGLR